MSKEYVEIGAVIREALQCSARVADGACHALNVVLPSEPVYVHADGARMTRVFTNLLNNVCMYTPAGGTMSIMVERDDGDVVATVQDNGAGMPPERLEGVLATFEQLDCTLTHLQGDHGSRFIVRLAVVQPGGR